MSKNSGFTLLEIVIVLAVIGALAAMIAPRAFTYLEDARRTQAQNDANRIAEAIGKFVQDTGLPPYKNNASSPKNQVWQMGVDFDCLYSSSGNDFATTTDETTSDSWTSGGGVQCQSGSATRDTIENHLIKIGRAHV